MCDEFLLRAIKLLNFLVVLQHFLSSHEVVWEKAASAFLTVFVYDSLENLMLGVVDVRMKS